MRMKCTDKNSENKTDSRKTRLISVTRGKKRRTHSFFFFFFAFVRHLRSYERGQESRNTAQLRSFIPIANSAQRQRKLFNEITEYPTWIPSMIRRREKRKKNHPQVRIIKYTELRRVTISLTHSSAIKTRSPLCICIRVINVIHFFVSTS